METIKINFDQDQLFIMNILIAFVMFGVALDLKWSDFKGVLSSLKAIFTGFICQFLLLPASACGLCWLLALPPQIALGVILVASCPGGNLSNFLTSLGNGNKALSIVMSAFATLLSVLMTPFNISLWGGLYPPAKQLLQQVEVSPIEVGKTVMLILIIPTILAVLFSKKFPALSVKANKFFKIMSVLIFLGFVGGAFSKNWHIFVGYIDQFFVPVLLVNAAGLCLGYGFSRMSGLAKFDARAVMFETGVQNAAFGLVLIFNYFDGMGAMAMVAGWYGIWHITTGLPIAFILSKKKLKLNSFEEARI